ncbi:MAG: hypothetical protein H7255_16705 [Ramlibacter sp.]|nr:hypothetical protein [Ramlibacter sp.]
MTHLLQRALTPVALSFAIFVSACGGGEAERVTVSTTVPHAQAVHLSDGTLAFPGGLEPNYATKQSAVFAQAGIVILSTRCNYQPHSGYATVDGIPPHSLIFEIYKSDVDKAIIYGYQQASPSLDVVDVNCATLGVFGT